MRHRDTEITEDDTQRNLSVHPLCSLCLCVAFFCFARVSAEPAPPAAQLHWLDKTPPPTTQGVSWGVPWPRGAVAKGATFRLTDDKGGAVPVQSWAMAYWPDGSLKWTGHAVTATPEFAGPLSIAPGEPAPAQSLVKVNDSADS